MVKNPDSIDKIVTVYLAATCIEPFEYKRKEYTPRTLILSPLIFREFICFERCGACCPLFSLDFLPNEPHPYKLKERFIEINGKSFSIYSDCQENRNQHHCKNLNLNSGRCTIHTTRPFTCDFELLRFSISINKKRPNYLCNRLFGRGWNLLRCNNERGALCQLGKYSENTKQDILRRLLRLKDWADWFNIKTCLPVIIKWVSTGSHNQPLTIWRKYD